VGDSWQSLRRLGQWRRRSDFRNRSRCLEEARVLGELHKQGWESETDDYLLRVGRRKSLAAGSTEWVETHRDELQNMRSLTSIPQHGRGFFHAGGSHDLQRLINDVRATFKIRRRISPFNSGRVCSALPTHTIPKTGPRSERATTCESGRWETVPTSAFHRPRGHFGSQLGYGGENDGDSYTHLRRSFLVHQVHGYRFFLRTCAGANRRDRGHAVGGRRPDSLRIQRGSRDHRTLRERTEKLLKTNRKRSPSAILN